MPAETQTNSSRWLEGDLKQPGDSAQARCYRSQRTVLVGAWRPRQPWPLQGLVRRTLCSCRLMAAWGGLCTCAKPAPPGSREAPVHWAWLGRSPPTPDAPGEKPCLQTPRPPANVTGAMHLPRWARDPPGILPLPLSSLEGFLPWTPCWATSSTRTRVISVLSTLKPTQHLTLAEGMRERPLYSAPLSTVLQGTRSCICLTP